MIDPFTSSQDEMVIVEEPRLEQPVPAKARKSIIPARFIILILWRVFMRGPLLGFQRDTYLETSHSTVFTKNFLICGAS